MPIAKRTSRPASEDSMAIHSSGSVVELRSVDIDTAERISGNLEYIADMCRELASIAGRNQSARVARLLREAGKEAQDHYKYLANHSALQTRICGG